MLSTEKGRRQKAEGRRQLDCLRAALRRMPLARCLLLSAFCLLLFGCRMDMQDQPRYEALEPSTFFDDGQASRPLVEGTVPRGERFKYMDEYRYSGKLDGAQNQAAGVQASGAASGAQSGGTGAAAANTQATNTAGAQPTGDVNVRGNVGGGVPGAQPAGMGGPDRFPAPVTKEMLDAGQERYNVYCALCHGMTGEGDGMIVRRGFRRPPSFHEERLQAGQANAAHFFDVITNGWGAMPSYSEQITSEDRWKIIAYVRALQLSRRGSLADVPADKRNALGSGAPQQTPPHAAGEGGQHR